jgi:hypothetical protein
LAAASFTDAFPLTEFVIEIEHVDVPDIGTETPEDDDDYDEGNGYKGKQGPAEPTQMSDLGVSGILYGGSSFWLNGIGLHKLLKNWLWF